MNIAVLGTGNIGKTLGEKWAKAGHTVTFGTRDPQKPELQALLTSLGGKAQALSTPQAIAASEIVLFAIPGKIMEETVTANAAALDGKILIDAANKITSPVINNFKILTTQTPNAKIYRAFNNYGWENFETPQIGSNKVDVFYCGTEGDSQKTVDQLITDMGANPVYIGGADQVEVVDSILKLWFALSSGQKKGRHLAFKVLTP